VARAAGHRGEGACSANTGERRIAVCARQKQNGYGKAGGGDAAGGAAAGGSTCTKRPQNFSLMDDIARAWTASGARRERASIVASGFVHARRLGCWGRGTLAALPHDRSWPAICAASVNCAPWPLLIAVHFWRAVRKTEVRAPAKAWIRASPSTPTATVVRSPRWVRAKRGDILSLPPSAAPLPPRAANFQPRGAAVGQAARRRRPLLCGSARGTDPPARARTRSAPSPRAICAGAAGNGDPSMELEHAIGFSGKLRGWSPAPPGPRPARAAATPSSPRPAPARRYRCFRRRRARRAAGRCLLFHPNGRDIVYAAGGCVVVADLGDPHNQVFLRGHDDLISALALSASGRYIASGQVPAPPRTRCGPERPRSEAARRGARRGTTRT
jgi:hypothetical protein